MNNKILIVDDIEINRDMLEMILGDTYDILQAEDGNQALEIVDQYRETIVAILLDLIMPVMDGFEFMDEFRLHKEYDNIPVIVATSNEDWHSEKKCLEAGV